MSSPAAAPAGSPPDSASPPPSSSAAPPTTSSSPPSPPPSSPPPPVSSPSPPAPPPASSPPPPAQDSTPPPAKSTPPPPISSSPPEQSPPPPAQSSSPPAASPPTSVTSPPPSQTTLTPPPPSDKSSPPPPGTSNVLSPPPPPSTPSNPTTPTTSSPSPSSSSSGTIPTSTLAVIVVVGVLAVSILLVLVLCLCKKKKKRYYYSGDHHGPPPGGLPSHYKDSYYDPNANKQGLHSPYSSQSSDVLLNMPPPPPPPPFMMSDHDLASSRGNSGASQGIGNSKPWFTYADLAAATNGFSKANLLGEGGFGCVYKGVLSNGQVVAVKQLKSGASQGEKEFQAEVEIISRVHHRHLVSLVGYCIADSQRLLVYDYVPNNTLEYHLHKRKGVPALDWPTRLKIASGAARGLAYLHEDCHPRIIHRDIKSANILLDNNFDAQVSDFGLAKLTSDTHTHVTTRVMGTFGYLAPEYAASGKLTDKSDVFSFGVVLLELITGRKSVDVSQPPGQESLVEWARPILAQVESAELDMLVDPSLNGVYDPKEMMRMVEAAAACVRHSANKRPRMGQVVRALEDEISLADLNKGLKPGHSSAYGSSFSSSEYETGSYSADIRKFRMVLNENDTGVTSNPYSSSEYQTSLEIDRDGRRPPMRMTPSAVSSSNEFSSGK